MESAAATAPATSPFDGFVGQDRSVARENPHAMRFAYMPGVWYAQANPRTTGWTHFSQGTLIAFRSFPIGGEQNPAFLEDPNQNSLVREITAEQAAINASIEYQTLEGVEHGFVSLPFLTGLEMKAYDYLQAVHPDFKALSHECPSGLSVCPTCRIQWFESDGYARHYAEMKQTFGLDDAIANQLRDELLASNRRYADYCAEQWNILVDDHERSRNGDKPFVLSASHHHYRRAIHALTPDEKEERRLTAITSANANAIAGALGGGTSGGLNLTDAELAEIYAKRAAASQGKTPKTTDASNAGVDDNSSDIGFEVGSVVMHGDSPAEVLEIKSGGWVTIQLKDSGDTKTVRRGELAL